VNWMDDNLSVIDVASDTVIGQIDGGQNNRSVGQFIGR
jgi:YVTN family beta-propeller protein